MKIAVGAMNNHENNSDVCKVGCKLICVVTKECCNVVLPTYT